MNDSNSVPLLFNLILWALGLIVFVHSLVIAAKTKWYLALPLSFYSLHFSAFYAMIAVAQMRSHELDPGVMMIWSAVLRFQGIITALAMMYIIYFVFGRQKNEQ